MTTFSVVGTVTGLVTVYLLLSLLCMAVNEYIQARLKYRARDLEKWIMSIFDAHADAMRASATEASNKATEKAQAATAAPGNAALAKEADIAKELEAAAQLAAAKAPDSKLFYESPLIQALYTFKSQSGPGIPILGPVRFKPVLWDEKPAYIPSSTFALALMRTVFPDIGSTAAPETTDYRTAIQNLPDDSPLKPTLQALLNAAGNDLATFRGQIEGWYDSAMDRVAGAYKRIMMRSLFWLGLVASLAVNADTFQFATAIASSEPLQQAFGAALPALTAQGATPPASCLPGKDSVKPTNCLDVTRVLGELQAAGLPIGWANPKFRPLAFSKPSDLRAWWRENLAVVASWLYKVAGCVLTAFAVSLGAPFWFDVLNKIMVVRSTVKPAEKSKTEASKS